MKIVGTSGVSILLAGQIMMRYDPIICIKESELVNRHSAVLRFKSEKISEFLNIPFKKVTIDKAIIYENKMYDTSNLKLQNMYSQKVTGNVLDRSIRNMGSEVRYIAPDNLFDLLKIGLNIKTGCDLMDELFNRDLNDPALSYVKMPDLMDRLKVEKPKFSFNPVYTLNANIINPQVDVYQTIYYPGDEDWYRASITGNNLIVEFIREPKSEQLTSEDLFRSIIDLILKDFGISNYGLSEFRYSCLPVGKMNPIDDSIRKSFISRLTRDYNIYSFGRNGIWKSIRLDSLYEDVHKIDKMIRGGSYERLKMMTP